MRLNSVSLVLGFLLFTITAVIAVKYMGSSLFLSFSFILGCATWPVGCQVSDQRFNLGHGSESYEIFLLITIQNWLTNTFLASHHLPEPFCHPHLYQRNGSILAWEIPWTEKPGGLRSIGSQRVGHEWSNLAHAHTWGQHNVRKNNFTTTNIFFEFMCQGIFWALHV